MSLDFRPSPCSRGCSLPLTSEACALAYVYGFYDGRATRQALQEWPESGCPNPREFELPGEDAILRKDGERLILEPATPPSLLAALATLKPLDEEFSTINDAAPEHVDL